MVSDLFAAVVQGVVEGITEFLPVSSTGHLIISGHFLGFEDDRAKIFDIFIQLGAILAIVWIYRRRFTEVLQTAAREPASRLFVLNLLLGFLPAAVLGLLLHHWIKAHLFTPVTVAWAEKESRDFFRQSKAFAQKLGAPAIIGEGLNHFEIVETLADPRSPLGRAALNMLQ